MASYIPGVIAILLGIIFVFFNRNISKGAAAFYRRFYTEKNLKAMFLFLGLFLIFIGIVIIVSS